MPTQHPQSKYGLENHGLKNLGRAHWNHNTPSLYEAIVRRGEGHIAHLGPVIVRTGSHTGRAAKDKFIVAEPTTEKMVWWGAVNKPFPEEQFKLFFRRVLRRVPAEHPSAHWGRWNGGWTSPRPGPMGARLAE